jgi:hypothetical protein
MVSVAGMTILFKSDEFVLAFSRRRCRFTARSLHTKRIVIVDATVVDQMLETQRSGYTSFLREILNETSILPVGSRRAAPSCQRGT